MLFRPTPIKKAPAMIRVDTGSSLNFNDDTNENDSFEIALSMSQTIRKNLYEIQLDRDSGMLKATFSRDEELYTPDLNETHNFRFFYFLKPDQITDVNDSELIIDVKRFFGLLRVGILDENREYILMRWSPGFDCWTASKYNRFKAKDFLKGYCFINSLLSKSSRGMHYDEKSLDFSFR